MRVMRRLWSLRLFGQLSAETDGVMVTRFRTQKTAALLAYLACHADRPHPREELIAMLWPDADPDAGRHSLSQALTSLRHQLEPPGVAAGSVVVSDRNTVRLNPEAFSADVVVFEEQVAGAARADDPSDRRERLERAAQVYGGELLPGFYEDWVLARRDRYAAQMLDALRALASQSAATGHLDLAIDYARRAVDVDPLCEEAHADLMTFYAADGRASSVVRQYAELERVLRRELDVEPSDETRRLLAELKSRPVDATTTAARKRVRRPVQPEQSLEPGTSESADSRPYTSGRLPLQITRFFGRANEISRLSKMLVDERERIVTLTGPGGTGKTRLAIEAAARVAPEIDDAVWFVPLADVDDPDRILDVIRDVLGAPAGDLPAFDRVLATLGTRSSLLVLDNFEQLLPAGATVIRSLVTSAPGLACLVTSRRVLGVSGERELVVEPLAAPSLVSGDTLKRLSHYESVQLFVDRARAVRPDFQITRHNALLIAELCRRLEGIPLAIELAAARAHVLTIAQMLERLDERLDGLATRRADAPARHRTLRAAVEWSDRLLAPEPRRLFVMLSVFRGGWSLESAEAVSGLSSALELLSELRESSLVVSEERGGEMRFRMLETLREYAEEQLDERDAGELRDRHAAEFIRLAESIAPSLFGPGQMAAVSRLDFELENLRAALRWVCESGRGDQALRLGIALSRYWELHGHAVEGRAWLEAALAMASESETSLRAKGLLAAAGLARLQGEYERMEDLATASLDLARIVEDRVAIADALSQIGNARYFRGKLVSARDATTESLAIREELGDERGIAVSSNNLGNVAQALGENDTAEAFYRETERLSRKVGDRQYVAIALNNLALIAERRGDAEDRRARLEESLVLYREIGDRTGEALTLSNLGEAAIDRGDRRQARQLFRESIAVRLELGDRWGIADGLESFANLLATGGQPELAMRLLGAALEMRAKIGSPPNPQVQARVDSYVAACEGVIGADAVRKAIEAGRALDIRQAVEEARNAPDSTEQQ